MSWSPCDGNLFGPADRFMWEDGDIEIDEDPEKKAFGDLLTTFSPGELINEAKVELACSERNETKGIDKDPDPSPNPGATELREYWVHGEGAAKIKWGAPHDFDRCVNQLRKYVGPGAEGLCNVYHRSAMGAPPGKGHKSDSSVMKRAERVATEMKDVSHDV